MVSSIIRKALQAAVLLSLPFVLFPTPSSAQNTFLKGKVLDTKGAPVAFASIVVSTDSTGYEGMHFAATKEDGSFVVDNLGTQPDRRWVHVRSLGYKSARRQVKLSEIAGALEFRLEAASVEVDKVLVRGRGRDVYVKGDTLVFTSRNYITGGERNIGEVVNKMPGMEVDKSGNVTYQGRKVGKVLVNGKDVLSSSSGLAMNTLPADFANSIELFQNYSNGDIDQAFKAEEQMALNLKSAKGASVSGKVEAGGGVMKRYYAKASLLSLVPPVSVTALANGNNIGEPVLSMQDYVASMVDLDAMRASGGGVASLSLSDEEEALLKPPSDEYGRDAGVGNLNLTWIPSDSYQLRSSTLYTVGRSLSSSARFDDYWMPGTSLQSRSDERFDMQSHKLSEKLTHRWMPGPRFSLNARTLVDGRWSAANSALLHEVAAQQYDARKDSKTNAWSAYQSLDLKFLVGKGLIFGSINGRYSEEKYKNLLQANDAWLPLSYKTEAPRYPYVYNLKDRDADASLNADFGAMYPIYKDIFVKGSVSGKAYVEWYRMHVENRDADLERGRRYELLPYLGIVKNKGIVRFQAGAYFSLYDIELQTGQTNRYSLFRIEPYGNLTFVFDVRHRLSLSASESVKPIGASYFLQQQRMNSYYVLRQPSMLENPYARNFSGELSYMYFSLFHRLSFYTMASYSLTWDKQVSEGISNGVVEQRRYWDGGRNESVSARAYLGKGIGLLPLEVKLRGNYVWGNSNVLIASMPDVITYQYYSVRLEFISRFTSSWINFELQGFFGHDDQHQRARDVKVTTMDYGAEAQCHFRVKSFTATLAGEYSHVQEASRHRHFYDVSAQLRYSWKFLELRLQANDILHLRSNEWIREDLGTVSYTREIYGRMPGSIIMTVGYTF